MEPSFLMLCWTSLSVSHTSPKMVPPYSLGICPPKIPRHIEALSLLHQEKIDFLKTLNFDKNTQTSLESPKIDMSKLPKEVIGDVISCFVSKFDKKIPMGSVPNYRKEVPMLKCTFCQKKSTFQKNTGEKSPECENSTCAF